MAKPPTEKNERLKKEMLARVSPEQAAKFEARRKIKADLIEAVREGNLDAIKKMKDNEFNIDITKVWYKKGRWPKVTADADAYELAVKWKKQDLIEYFEGLGMK